MEITFNLPHVFSPVSPQVDNACALRALLDCMVALNLAYLRFHTVPSLYASGVKYGRTTIWEPTPALYLPNKHRSGSSIYWQPFGTDGGKQRGDCKSLSAARIAELIHSGKKAEPVFRWANRADGSGALDFHILVMLEGGRWEDPSRKLGMGQNEVARFYSDL